MADNIVPNSQPQKAVRATILLGDISIDCYMLPNGEYQYDYAFLADIIDRDKSILSNKKSPFYLPNLLEAAPLVNKNTLTVVAEVIGKSYRYKTVSQSQLMVILKAVDQNALNVLKSS